MPRLTEKQSLFCKAMFTVGSETFGNGTKSARIAGYKGSDDYLARVASENVRKCKIIKEKARIQAKTNQKLSHDREIAIKILNEALTIAREKGDGPGIVQACRELDAISWLHGTMNADFSNKELEELDDRKLAEARRVAQIRIREGA